MPIRRAPGWPRWCCSPAASPSGCGPLIRPAGCVPSAVVGFAVAAFTVKLASFAPAMAALHLDRYDAGTVTALLDINDASFGVSWALDGVFVLLLGLGAWATHALPRWAAGWAVLAGLSILVGIVLGPVFDALQPVFLLWLLAASGWLLARGGRAPVATSARQATQPATQPAADVARA